VDGSGRRGGAGRAAWLVGGGTAAAGFSERRAREIFTEQRAAGGSEPTEVVLGTPPCSMCQETGWHLCI
jgi:hypothetical protein